MLNGKRRHDFEVSYTKAVNCLLKERETTPEYRDEAVNELIEGYYAEIGEYPSEQLLTKLADVLLTEELRDPNHSKHRYNEYSILSEDQLARKRTGNRTAKKHRKMEVPFDEEEVTYFHHDMLREFNVYKPLLAYDTTRLDIINEITEYEAINKEQPISISYIEPQPVEYEPKKESVGRGEDNRVWALAVKERDKYTCQNPNCNSRVGIMHAHHIDSYVDNEDLRTELSNGVTLCESCHISFHSTFGRGGNNHEQIRKFFEI